MQGKEIGLAAFDRALTYYNRNLQGKPYVCHVPPGNPDRSRTLSIADEAVPAHLAHGDTLGRCEDREEADETAAAEHEPAFSPVEPLGKGPALAGPDPVLDSTRAPRGVGKGKRID